jgi:predicted CxxxxCH...CXXCH cytochrome family protein
MLAAACGPARNSSEDPAASDCRSCHGAPPTSGAHLVHSSPTALASLTGVAYGQEWITADKDPTGVLGVYSFGCGLCHPKDLAKHQNGSIEVDLSAVDGAAGGLRARNGATASYNKGDGTCSNVYCHSSGQATPTYVKTPGWNSGTHLGCNGCHDDPPSYPNGGPGTATANSHIFLNWLGIESGHFAGEPGPVHNSRHGHPSLFAPSEQRASPITCQTCHFDTVDATNVATGGFFYLDTGITTRLPGGAAGRFATAGWKDTQCLTCHDGQAGSPAQGAGKVRPLLHVNGTRDVVFDKRLAPPATWLFGSVLADATPSRQPSRPYFTTGATYPVAVPAFSGGGFDTGSTLSFELSDASYTPNNMTCSAVACHLGQDAVWGRQNFQVSPPICNGCHSPP